MKNDTHLEHNMTTTYRTYRFPSRAYNAEGVHVGPGQWLDLIRAANGVAAGTFAQPDSTGPWWAGGYVEEYEHARVIHDTAGQTVRIVAKTEHGDYVLAAASALLEEPQYEPTELVRADAQAALSFLAATGWPVPAVDQPEAPAAVLSFEGVQVTITRSAGNDGAVLVLVDTDFEPDASDRGPGLRVLVNDDTVFAGVAYLPEPVIDPVTGEVVTLETFLAEPAIPTEPLAQAEYTDLLEARVREFVQVATDQAIDRFPNDAAAALRYASSLLADSAEEV